MFEYFDFESLFVSEISICHPVKLILKLFILIMKSVFGYVFISLFVLGISFTLTSGRRYKYSPKRHYRRQRLEEEKISYESYKVLYPHRHLKYHTNYKHFYPRLKDSEKYDHASFLRTKQRNSLRLQGKGVVSKLLDAPTKFLHTLFVKRDPLQAIKDLFNGISGAGKELVSKFGEFASGIQTMIYNLAGDEINDFHGAADKPINYQLFTSKNKKTVHLMDKTGSVEGTFWNKNRKTKVIIHGFSASLKETNTTLDLLGLLTIKNSYLDSGSLDNIIVADWTSLARTLNYISAAAATRIAGDDLAKFLQKLYEQKNLKSFDDVHIIGFSLGAQVSGVAGRLVEEYTEEKIGRITGLDPAEPQFGQLDGEVPRDARFVLDKSDAKFVDIVHCNAGLLIPFKLGLRAVSGHADFFPNGGALQPGCGITPGCSHSRCWQLYSESIGSKKFSACKCESWKDFKADKCKCKSQEKVYMGELCSRKARGKYYLKANIDKEYKETLVRGSFNSKLHKDINKDKT